ncbi:helix-turn-helix domain-containing protein [Catenovulum sp. SM1970]|uniref:helix-turn-helix domain-containing protein n=1 Tax=Marinifaba aquimaris TaxID=2741323 RepID=UPI001574BDCB|nr:helix-turn-helix domain-containing protein [Marinifaba aquimaris]NTS77404.1 helix-turn-helix domain-containing protein [Marinifaba aquimaris]
MEKWPIGSGIYTHQVFLGDEAFAKRFLKQDANLPEINEVPKVKQSREAKPLPFYQTHYPKRNDAIVKAYQSGGYTQQKLADYFGVHYSTISRIMRDAKSKT